MPFPKLAEQDHADLNFISGYPGSVSIRFWNGAALEVTSDALLSQPKFGIGHLELLSDEVFSWDFVTGTVTPLRIALRDLVSYYASGIASSNASLRRETAYNLLRLKDVAAVPLLERALATETDAHARTLMFDALLRLHWLEEVPPQVREAAAHYRQHHDLPSLEISIHALRLGIPREQVEYLLGEPDWAVEEVSGRYISDRKVVTQQVDHRGVILECPFASIGLHVEFRDRNGNATGRLESFEIGPIGE